MVESGLYLSNGVCSTNLEETQINYCRDLARTAFNHAPHRPPYSISRPSRARPSADRHQPAGGDIEVHPLAACLPELPVGQLESHIRIHPTLPRRALAWN